MDQVEEGKREIEKIGEREGERERKMRYTTIIYAVFFFFGVSVTLIWLYDLANCTFLYFI